MKKKNEYISYSEAIRVAKKYCLKNYKNFIILGQGVTSPWYVGSTMKDLDKEFKSRIIETPVSENSSTSIAFGATLTGLKTLIVHPRMDFMLYAMDSIVNHISKWSLMFGEKIKSPVTIRAIVNRGSEQGAQHSQSLHSWFMHIPGLKVVMPSSANDARDLLISSILSDEPVIFIDDRWLYETREIKKKIKIYDLSKYKNKKIINGNDITIVSSGYCTHISKEAINILNEKHKVFPELIDISLLSNLPINIIEKSLKKTKKILCVEGGWEVCSLSSEIFSRIFTKKSNLKKGIIASKINLYNTAAPTSSKLENHYFPNTDSIIKKVLRSINY